MPTFSKTLSTTAMCLILSATAGMADVTSRQVWDDWKTYLGGMGSTLEAQERVVDDGIEISDIRVSNIMPEGEGRVETLMPALRFTDVGDGSVQITLPAQVQILFEITPDSGETASGTVTYQTTDATLNASGDPDSLQYKFAASNLDFKLTEFSIDDAEIPPELFAMAATISDVTASTRSTAGEVRSYAQEMSIATLSYDMALDIPEQADGSKGKISGTLNGVSFTGSGALPLGFDQTDFTAMIGAGFATDGAFAFTSGTGEMQLETPDGAIDAKTSSQGGTIGFLLGPEGIGYETQQTNLTVEAGIPNFPFPVSMNIAQSSNSVLIPLIPSEDTQEFGFSMLLQDFTISDTIWGLFDPAGQLPRDPLTIGLDLSGTAKILTDLMNPDVDAFLDSEEVPGELNTLDLHQLIISGAGAEITGEGGFTFDNTDLDTFGGFPRPEGAIDMRATGVFALMDKLVEMGLLPAEQVMGGRMVLGMFTRPVSPDVLTSKIEINAAGEILANGQRMR